MARNMVIYALLASMWLLGEAQAQTTRYKCVTHVLGANKSAINLPRSPHAVWKITNMGPSFVRIRSPLDSILDAPMKVSKIPSVFLGGTGREWHYYLAVEPGDTARVRICTPIE